MNLQWEFTFGRLTINPFPDTILVLMIRNWEMKYTLVTGKGKVYTFFIKAVAETYQQAYGGTIITNKIFTKETKNETFY